MDRSRASGNLIEGLVVGGIALAIFALTWIVAVIYIG